MSKRSFSRLLKEAPTTVSKSLFSELADMPLDEDTVNYMLRKVLESNRTTKEKAYLIADILEDVEIYNISWKLVPAIKRFITPELVNALPPHAKRIISLGGWAGLQLRDLRNPMNESIASQTPTNLDREILSILRDQELSDREKADKILELSKSCPPGCELRDLRNPDNYNLQLRDLRNPDNYNLQLRDLRNPMNESIASEIDSIVAGWTSGGSGLYEDVALNDIKGFQPGVFTSKSGRLTATRKPHIAIFIDASGSNYDHYKLQSRVNMIEDAIGPAVASKANFNIFYFSDYLTQTMDDSILGNGTNYKPIIDQMNSYDAGIVLTDQDIEVNPGGKALQKMRNVIVLRTDRLTEPGLAREINTSIRVILRIIENHTLQVGPGGTAYDNISQVLDSWRINEADASREIDAADLVEGISFPDDYFDNIPESYDENGEPIFEGLFGDKNKRIVI